jgi:hypothetical protein
MTSALKHKQRSHRSHTHFTTSRNYKIKVVDEVAQARRPKWFWSLVERVNKFISGFGKQDRW